MALMPTVAERVSVVEVQIANLDEKLDEIKVDVKDLHDCLDRTGDDLKAALKEMDATSCRQHTELSNTLQSANQALNLRISEIEKLKAKWTYLALGAAAAIGWLGHMDLTKLIKLLGM